MNRREIGGSLLNVACQGSGKSSLILVHGGTCDSSDWNGQQDLASFSRVVTFDLPGHGTSGPAVSGSVEALGRCVREVSDEYGQGRAVLVGHGVACRYILEAVRQSAKGVIGLVMIEGHLVGRGDPDEAVRALKVKLQTLGVRPFLERTIDGMFTPRSDPALRRHALSRVDRLDPVIAEELLLSVVGWDAGQMDDALTAVKVPVLMLQSSHLDFDLKWQSLSKDVKTPWTQKVVAKLPDARLQVIAGAGHFTQVEAAPAVNSALREFVADLEGN
jgi:pimeloyl-[acyl-carrier protein] methyl ester esterase